MPPLRFLHTADLHLGKPFGRQAEADRLRVARMDVLPKLAAIAKDADAPHVLIAGDLFDAPNPAAATWRKAVAVMAEAGEINWWLLPGNHDNLAEGRRTWSQIAAAGHTNVHVLDKPEPVALRADAMLLPAPLAQRRPTSDPTAWMDGFETEMGVMRIGLAHGPVQGFGEGDLPPDVIAPDRADSARLDYLALGDWHGTTRIGERTHYSGAPERTDFRHDGQGVCLLVEVDGPGAPPRVTPRTIGQFDWRSVTLNLLPGDDPGDRLRSTLPDRARRDMLLQVTAQGRLPLRDISALTKTADTLAPDFCHFEIRMDGLETEVEAADLDDIAPTGALRQVGNTLAARAEDSSLAERDRDLASAALRRLHAIATASAK